MKLFEWFFSNRKLDSKNEIEVNQKEILKPKTSQIVDDLPLGYYYGAVDSYGAGRKEDVHEAVIKSLIERYRRMELVHEVDDAIDIIVNDMFIPDEEGVIVKLDLKYCEMPDKIKEKVVDIFNNKILNLFNFNNDFYDMGRTWFRDGRINYNVVVNMESTSKGIQQLIPLDAMDIFLSRDRKEVNKYRYYYKYYNRDLGQNDDVHPDFIIYVGSNKFDRIDYKNPVEISYLHRAFKPLNNLKNIEDSVIISRLVRSPERRIFTVNTGSLGKTAAEEYIKKLMRQFKNQLVFNTQTGEVDVYKLHHSMVEDFWFPENLQGKGTKVDTIKGDTTFKDLDDLYYFSDNFYDSLKIPQSRRNTDKQQERSMYSTNAEIERDEIIFFKFIQRLRKQFSKIFMEALKRELVWTKVLSKNDFEKIKNRMLFIYNNDNLYEEMKQGIILNTRLNNLNMVQPYIGKFYTFEDIAYDILKFTEEEWKAKQKDFKKNKKEYDKIMGMEDMSGGSNYSFNKEKFDFKRKPESPLVDDEEEQDKKVEKEKDVKNEE